MTLNDNKIDYVHWDYSNELVDRLRLFEILRQTGHNAHDNKILSRSFVKLALLKIETRYIIILVDIKMPMNNVYV